eukprot:TRINITY_DN107451_c0_g1_i1.p1 TRINITY_DN107451_c0_g1~~TRINITY_DN107451_c0_g1_i1.p1  ORF type:complete len:185 (+),score=5.11 TRINITY_DN107451_c0_g1_i1:54-608(+)
MSEPVLSVREIQDSDTELFIDYWLNSSKEHLLAMGVDAEKVPPRETWREIVRSAIESPMSEKNMVILIWEVDGKPVGHSSSNRIAFGETAHCHLHMWDSTCRKKGYGTVLFGKSVAMYFEMLQLKKLCCEPYAKNPAANKTLPKHGFEFVKTFVGVPGWLNFEQEINLYELTRERHQAMLNTPP